MALEISFLPYRYHWTELKDHVMQNDFLFFTIKFWLHSSNANFQYISGFNWNSYNKSKKAAVPVPCRALHFMRLVPSVTEWQWTMAMGASAIYNSKASRPVPVPVQYWIHLTWHCWHSSASAQCCCNKCKRSPHCAYIYCAYLNSKESIPIRRWQYALWLVRVTSTFACDCWRSESEVIHLARVSFCIQITPHQG